MRQSVIIAENRETIRNLDSEKYPTLSRLCRKTSVFRSLDMIMQHMLTYRCPVWPEHNRRYYLFSTTYLKDWCRETFGTRCSAKTWQGYAVFLDDIGLLKRIRATGSSEDPFLNSVWQKAVERSRIKRTKKIISETLWSVPRYTDAILKQAEETAKLYVDNYVNLSHLSMSDVIILRGQARAKELYHDNRTLSEEEVSVRNWAKEVIRGTVDQNGYMMASDLKDALWNKISLELHFTHPDPMRQNEWTPEELDGACKEKTYQKEMKKALTRRKAICKECGCELRRITKAVKERFQLEGKSWIILDANINV